jgi:hypothetical protein
VTPPVSVVFRADRPRGHKYQAATALAAATTHGQRRGRSGFFSTRSRCRRALSVAGSPSKYRSSSMM